MSQVDHRTVKLGEVLASLIERQGYSRNRQKILDSVGISSSALSQYLREQSKPSFEKLVALARFFDVSLDYLVFGQRAAPSMDSGPVPAMIEHALADARARTSRHAAIVRRITRVLADRVDDVARELSETPNASREGLLQDDELLRLERYARSVDVLSPDLDFDVVTLPDGSTAPGAFLEQVVSNLARSCTYRFLASAEEGSKSGTALRQMLVARAGGDAVAAECDFRVTSLPVLVGICLVEIDITPFSAEEPALYEQLETYISAEGWIGYVIRPNRESNADMVMSKDRRESARQGFDAAWRSAQRRTETPAGSLLRA
ncbi:helix-turn-helix protein [Actinomycetospora succinea]|uniref:Helix-turn-helix protein n=1 Tax=Actinomycetospora succinea TaxID=663603 RepID=A0A4R6VFL1_9PSEU|nr:helix-turn-helix transcriptional regulator [Actinomycetospora succinea]TDQ61121.1 helix-turn-helix protein [Actinomycetospora succinea]